MSARPFHRQQHRAGPFATDAYSLYKSKDGENDCAPNADSCIGRYQCDPKGCESHAQKRSDKRHLVAAAVTMMAEYGSTNWPGDDADVVRSEGGQRRRQRVLVRKIELAEHETGRQSVKEKIVPVCAENLNPNVAVMKSAQEGVCLNL
jgi:hypothetical protein